MKNINKILFAGLVTFGLSSCSVIIPVSVSSNPIGSKTGTSKATVLFGTIYTNGKYGISDACKNGHIKGGASTVDEKITGFGPLTPFFYTRELTVTGE
jgi:hypothetical protein